ncbi:lipopolysaccharide biosynthesis protein [Sphingomonas hylomeconis]|uniref:Lipopolysaccharide biosynthesis protein n=1 Tax=Sphingomonas hylomeconis TaxID=1395958 RepID=A0ABV7SU16_9SPHN|nr:lipopolysaccharide biosynthesis protein [Sphingomonas hylomeconis]
MKHWFADGVFRTVLRNAGYLASGKLVGALLGLVALACAGRGLSLTQFGVLMIIHTYASGAGGLVKFQTWQYIVRYATPALHHGDERQARDVIRFAFGLDLASGLVGMIGAMALLPWLAGYFGIGGDYLWIAIAYCTLIPTMTEATATGSLRVLDRFDLIAQQQVVTPFLRGGGAAIAYFCGFGLPGFVLAWYVADLLGDLALWGFAVRELKRRNMLAALRPGMFGVARRLPEAWKFVWTTNAAHSVYAAWGPLSNLVVATILGPVAAGLYKIASTLLDSATKPADLLRKGYYPEIMRLDPREPRPWLLGIRTGLLAGGLGLLVVAVVLLGGKPLIALAFGQKYLPAFDLLKLMVFSLAIQMATFPLESLLYMAGRQGAALVAQLVAVAAYLTLLALLTHRFGLTGAGIAYLLGSVAVALCMLVPTLIAYRQRGRLPWPPVKVAAA